MTIEQAKEKLARINSWEDPLLRAFYGGRVGFRKSTKKYNQEMDRQLKKSMEVGKQYRDFAFGLVTVIKKNKNTVTVQTPSGYKEARKPQFIYKNKQ